MPYSGALRLESPMLEIKKCTIFELEDDPYFHALLMEYAYELFIDGLPQPSAKIETYKNLENMKLSHTIGAYVDGRIVGIINIIMVPNPHYGICIATTESYFVCKNYRKTGAGLKLLREAEKYSSKVNSPGIIVSAPTDGPLSEVLPKSNYRQISASYFKETPPCLN